MGHYDHKEKRTLFIFILIFILLVIGIAVSAYLSYRNFEHQFRLQTEHQLSAIAKLKVSELVNWRRERLSDAEMLRQNPVFASLTQAYFEDPQDVLIQSQVQVWLNSYQIYTDYDRIQLLDTKGQTRFSSSTGLPPVSSMIASRIPEVLQSKQVTMVDFYQQDNDRKIRLSILIPIMDPKDGDQILGLAALSIDPEVYLYPFIQEWPIDSTSAETLLIRREGSEALFLNDLRFDSEAAMTLHFPLTQTEIPAVKAVLGQTGVAEGVDYRGKPVLADLRSVPDSPWFLVSKMDNVEVYAPLRTRLWQTFLLAGMAIFVAGTGLVTAWRQQRILFYRTQAEAAEALRESEKRYRVLVENMQVGVVVHGSDTSILFSNPMASQLLGLTQEQMRGKTTVDPSWCFIREDGTRAPLEEYPVNRALTSDVPISNIVLGILRPDRDGPIWVQYDAHQDREPDSTVRQIVVTFFEITDRKRAEETLQASEIRFRLAAESLTDVIYEWDLKERVDWYGDIDGMMGFSSGDFPRTLTGWAAMLHPDDKERVMAAIDDQLNRAIPYNIEYRVRNGNNEWRWWSARGAEVRDEHDEPKNWIGSISDITERKRAEDAQKEYSTRLETDVAERTRELREAQEQLVRQERLAILGQLAGSMGHELRNPLGVISNAIYFLKISQPDADDKIKEYLNIIENETRTSDKIITDLLDFARIKSVDRQLVSVPELIHQTLNRFPVPPAIELVLNIPPDPPQILADPHHVVQVLGNLTVNACQALPAIGGRLEISVALLNDMVSIAVHDNGVGISPENMNKLFEPLFTTKIKGIGLGLAVSRKLIEANGGRIEVQSEAGRGSTFTVFLHLESQE